MVYMEDNVKVTESEVIEFEEYTEDEVEHMREIWENERYGS